MLHGMVLLTYPMHVKQNKFVNKFEIKKINYILLFNA